VAKTKKPRFIDVVRYGEDLASLKINHPKRWNTLRAVAKKRGVTVAGLTSGAPAALQERTDAALRREAGRTVGSAYAPAREELNRRQQANANLAAARDAAETQYKQWLDGTVGSLRADAAAADGALALTNEKIHQELVGAQAATTTELAKRLQEARLTSDPSQSTALAGVAAGQQQALAKEGASREHSAALKKIGADSNTTAYASLLATAPARDARNRADNTKLANDVITDRDSLLLKQAADAASLLGDLRQDNRSRAQANREFGLAMGELGAKREQIASDLTQFNETLDLKKKEFNLARWQAQNRQLNDKLKIQIEYDKIAAQNGRAAADRALKRRVQSYKEAHPNAGGGGGGAADRKQERKDYQIIESLRSRAANAKNKGQSDAVIRANLLAKGYSDVQIDIALDLIRNAGALSPAGVRKARLIGMRPLRFWELSRPVSHPRT
jgi:hypothetical protein